MLSQMLRFIDNLHLNRIKIDATACASNRFTRDFVCIDVLSVHAGELMRIWNAYSPFSRSFDLEIPFARAKEQIYLNFLSCGLFGARRGRFSLLLKWTNFSFKSWQRKIFGTKLIIRPALPHGSNASESLALDGPCVRACVTYAAQVSDWMNVYYPCTQKID